MRMRGTMWLVSGGCKIITYLESQTPRFTTFTESIKIQSIQHARKQIEKRQWLLSDLSDILIQNLHRRLNLTRNPSLPLQGARPRLKWKLTPWKTRKDTTQVTLLTWWKYSTTSFHHFFTHEDFSNFHVPTNIFRGNAHKLISIEIKLEDVHKRLSSLREDKSAEADDVSPCRLLKYISNEIAQPLQSSSTCLSKKELYHSTGEQQMSPQFTRKAPNILQKTIGQSV